MTQLPCLKGETIFDQERPLTPYQILQISFRSIGLVGPH
jgi:hypothetical protein